MSHAPRQHSSGSRTSSTMRMMIHMAMPDLLLPSAAGGPGGAGGGLGNHAAGKAVTAQPVTSD